MDFYQSTLITALCLTIAGCSSSSGGSSSSIDDGIGATPNDIVLADNAIADANSLIISRDDIYDPNAVLNQNVCSAPYFETISGTYTGTISWITNTGFTNCSWNAEITLSRFYTPGQLRNSCSIDATFTTELTTPPVLPNILLTDEEDEVSDIEPFECLNANTRGLLNSDVIEPFLSNLRFPSQETIRLDVEVPTRASDGRLGRYPSGSESSVISLVDIVLQGDDTLTMPNALGDNPEFFVNMLKVEDDF